MKTVSSANDASGLTRRELIAGAGALAAAAGLGMGTSAVAGTGHEHHKIDSKREKIVTTALDCVGKGEICNAHCMLLFKEGDTSIAECAASVQEMLSACVALASLSAANSSHLKDFAKVCVAICEDCEKECREHEEDHAECKACADSCADCIDACKDYIA